MQPPLERDNDFEVYLLLSYKVVYLYRLKMGQ